MNIERNTRKIVLMGSTALTRPASAFAAAAMVLAPGAAKAVDATTLPDGGNVVGGAATISQSGARMDVNQSSNRTVIDWRSFDIGSEAHVNFDQPDTASIAVNRINASTNPTQINGRLTANGHVWVLNPNGVMFGATSRVDVAGIVASTGRIDAAQFMSGSNRIDFAAGAGGSVVNDGDITVRDGGLAAFVAPHVRNNGVIRARLSRVSLAAGETFTLDLAGDRLVELGLGAEGAAAEQFGQVVADGGVVEISAKAAGAVVDSIVNVDGLVSVASATLDGGDIVLSGDRIATGANATLTADAGTNGDGGTVMAYARTVGTYDGAFSARGGSESGNGGFVETSGKSVKVQSGIKVDTRAANGTTGSWSIDPDDLVVGDTDGPSSIAASTVVSKLDTTDVDLEANNSITVNTEIDSSSQTNSNWLTFIDENADNNLTINLNADIKLGANQTLAGEGTVVNVAAGTIQNGVDVASNAGAQVNVADGTYTENVTISKSNLTLVSQNGRDATTIQGVAGTSAHGAVFVKPGADNFTLGSTGHGFTVIGFDHTSPGLEKAAVYFQGSNTGSTLQGNRITADGEAGLLTEWGGTIVNMTIDGNIFDGQTFSGSNPGGVPADDQFATDNYPRELVYFGGNGNGANKQNIIFTNNQVTGTTGGLNASSQAQGRALVTIDAASATITGNTFSGTSDSASGRMLRARGGATVVSGNTFDTANMGADTRPLEVSEDIFTGVASGPTDFDTLIAANTFENGGIWTSDVSTGKFYVLKNDLQAAFDMVDDGGTVHMFNGTYTGDATLTIAKELTLDGESQGATIIDQSAVSGYGLSVRHDDVALSNFTFYGPTASSGSNYGIKVSPEGSATQLNNFTITNVTTRGAGRAELDLNGVVGATITNVTADGRTVADENVTTAGAGIQITDSQNVMLSGITTLGNDWGSIAFYQANRSYALQTDNITLDAATSSFSEEIGVFSQDESATNNFGTLNLSGFTNVVRNDDHRPTYNDGDQFTYFRTSLQDAIDYAVALTNGASSYIQDWSGTAATDTFTVGTATGGTTMSIATALDKASEGATVNVLDGTYASTAQLQIDKGLTLSGASEGGTILDQSGVAGYGMFVTGNSVTLSDFTFYGPSADAGGRYGIKVQPAGSAASSRLTDFTISNVTIRGSGRAELDLNGVVGATITDVTVDGRTVADENVTTKGAGLQITDSADVTVTGLTALGNDWGSVGIYQTNAYFDQQVNNITLNASQNSLGDDIGLYTEDESSTFDFGALNFANFTNIVRNPDHRSDGDEFTFFRTSVQDAIDFATSLASATSSYIQGWTGTAETDTFTVGTSTGGTAMSIATAIGAVDTTTATINVRAGTYDADNTVNKQGVTIAGASGAKVEVANGETGFYVTADNVTISGLEIMGPIADDWRDVDWDDRSVSFSIGINVRGGNTGGVFTNNSIHDIRTGININTGGNASITNNVIENTKGAILLRPSEITALSGNKEGTLGNEWGMVINLANIDETTTASTARQSFILGLSEANNGMSVLDRGYGAANRTHVFADAASGVTANDDFTFGNGLGNERQALPSLQAAVDATVAGGFIDVTSGTYAENVTASRQANFTFGDVTVNGLTLNGANSTLSGTLRSSASGFFLNQQLYLTGNTAFTTTGGAAFQSAGIDGTTAGAQTLTVNAGSKASIGSLGGTTRLGNTTINGQASLTGTKYAANNLTFNDDVTLTQKVTSFITTISSSAAGAITFLGDIFGTTSGKQSVVFEAGNGKSAASANGDITLQNAGTASVKLGDMDVTGDDFTADTVWLAGSFDDTVTGNQTFSQQTLNADGGVNSTVGGNATGPINSSSPVTINAGGTISGNVTGTNVTLTGTTVSSNVTATTVNITGTTVTGNISSSQGGTITANTVNVDLSGGSYTVNASGGSVTGSPSGLSYGTSTGSISVNGQTVVTSTDANSNQYVVEGFVLPEGTIITGTGQIILPEGLSLALISPAAGEGAGYERRVVYVRSVRRLGELLAEGYSAIVIDLSDGISEEEQELASVE